ncbi:hypothetical protein ARMGADRAFT_1092284 [Armillaria gallica]|uniref:Uncharacterized protein n=1 Tax=Armillaria gallica TaxID=47427 RepID=A0A2H3CBF0_ARMGA|nr:hypothetical protein ARMGADRAFT_1092284 [Armillaria gallica]
MNDIRRPSGLRPTIEEHASVMHEYRVQVPPLPPYRPPKPMSEIPSSLVEVLAMILSFLPRTAGCLVRRRRHVGCPAVDIPRHAVRSHFSHAHLRISAWLSPQTRAYFTHSSAITAPADSNADSRHVHGHYRQSASQSYHSRKPSASCHPLHALLSSNRRIYYHFYANLCRVSSYDYPRVSTTLCSPPPLHVQVCGQTYRGKNTSGAVVVCPAIEELEIEGKCWCSIVLHFNYLRVLVMRTPGTAQVKATKEELDERFPLPKCARPRWTSSTISHSGHSMVVSERARAAHLANACPALQHVVFLNGVQ